MPSVPPSVGIFSDLDDCASVGERPVDFDCWGDAVELPTVSVVDMLGHRATMVATRVSEHFGRDFDRMFDRFSGQFYGC